MSGTMERPSGTAREPCWRGVSWGGVGGGERRAHRRAKVFLEVDDDERRVEGGRGGRGDVVGGMGERVDGGAPAKRCGRNEAEASPAVGSAVCWLQSNLQLRKKKW